MLINLRDFYPFYTCDASIEVSDEIGAVLLESKREENNYLRRMYRHKAHYSLDRDDGIENSVLFVAMTPEELYERKVTMEQLYAAIATLPDKQAKRIYAHFFLGMSKIAIAKAEGVNESAIRKSLDRALRDIEIFLKKTL